MRRFDWFSGQTVLETDMDAFEDNIEKADQRGLDAFSLGALPVSGLVPSTDGSMVVGVTAGRGIAADVDGDARLVRLLANGTKSLAPAVPVANPKWVLLCLKFVRLNSQVEVDDTDADVNFIQDEDSVLFLVEGVENAAPVKPAIPADCVPIADFKLTVGQVALLTKHIDRSRARPANGRQGTTAGVKAQIDDLLAISIDNCRAYATEPADMKVHVRPGRVNLSTGSVVVAGQVTGDLALPAFPNSYIALIYLDSTGTVQVVYGEESGGAPVAPSHVGKIPLAHVTLVSSTTEILAADITDVRAFLRSTAEVPRYDKQEPGAAETVLTTPWAYVVGSHSLEVFIDGVKAVVGTDYTETDSTTVTFANPFAGTEVVEIISPLPGEVNPVVDHAPTHAAEGSDPIDYVSIGGLVLPGLRMYTSGDKQITVKPFAAIVNGRMRVSDADIVIGATLAALANYTWYYLYAYWDGAMQVEVVTTAPDSAQRRKTGDVSRTYLGAFMSQGLGGGASNVKAFNRVNRSTLYKVHTGSVEGEAEYSLTLHVANPGDTNPHDADLSRGFPPHVRCGSLLAVATVGGAGDYYAILAAATDGNAAEQRVKQLANSTPYPLEIPMVGQTIQVSASVNAGLVLDMYAVGYDD